MLSINFSHLLGSFAFFLGVFFLLSLFHPPGSGLQHRSGILGPAPATLSRLVAFFSFLTLFFALRSLYKRVYIANTYSETVCVCRVQYIAVYKRFISLEHHCVCVCVCIVYLPASLILFLLLLLLSRARLTCISAVPFIFFLSCFLLPFRLTQGVRGATFHCICVCVCMRD